MDLIIKLITTILNGRKNVEELNSVCVFGPTVSLISNIYGMEGILSYYTNRRTPIFSIEIHTTLEYEILGVSIPKKKKNN